MPSYLKQKLNLLSSIERNERLFEFHILSKFSRSNCQMDGASLWLHGQKEEKLRQSRFIGERLRRKMIYRSNIFYCISHMSDHKGKNFTLKISMICRSLKCSQMDGFYLTSSDEEIDTELYV